jgi:murein L,D-transpeptidase YafK
VQKDRNKWRQGSLLSAPFFLSFVTTATLSVQTQAVLAAGSLPSDPSEHKTVKEMIVLGVSKKDLRAELKTLPENGAIPQPIRSFKIAVGKVDGDKEKQGDNKTPEGIYFTLGRIDGSQLTPEKYGPLALPLNFPNPVDQMDGKTGHGIWLHGVGDRRIEDAKVTEGCVAFPNSEISSLAQWLKPSHGVVVIANDLAEVNRQNDLTDVYKSAQDWMKAWDGRDLDGYISFYDQKFHGYGKDLPLYREYKRAVFKRYKEMSVRMENVRIVTHPKYALMMMNQDFKGDKFFKSDGRKLLYWRKDTAGRWKIVREMFDNFLMNPVQFNQDDIAGLGQKGANNQLNKADQPRVERASAEGVVPVAH